MRHSSGKRIEKRAWGTFRGSRRANAGTATAGLLEKALTSHGSISSQQALLLQFLAADAVARPRDGVEALLVHRLATLHAAAEGALVVAPQRRLHEYQQIARA